jgi:hypothetical protein
MKIAVCFSGQLRTWKKCHSTWKSLIDQVKSHPKYEDETFEIDCFIHTWDFNTKPMSIVSSINYEPETIDELDIKKIKRLLKPKKIIVENLDKSTTRIGEMNKNAIKHRPHNIQGSVISWAGSTLYSMMRSSQLKLDYEIENNFKYDVCVKMRFDGSFDQYYIEIFMKDFNPPLKNKTIYSMHSKNVTHYPFELVGDIFFYSDSETFDVICSMYNLVPVLDINSFHNGIKIEEVLGHHIRIFDIKNVRSWLNVEIKR